MLKRYVYVLFLLFFLPSFLSAQSVKVKGKGLRQVTKEIVDPNFVPQYVKSTKTSPSITKGDPTVGESIGQTTIYDVFSNSVIRDQIVFSNGAPHFANMVRPWAGNAARRVVAYTYKAGDTYTTVPVFDPSANSGWPQIDVSLTGSAVGTIAIVGHTPNKLAIWDGTSSFLVSQFATNTDPSLQFVGDNIFLATSGNWITFPPLAASNGRDQFQFFKTSDFGISFTNFDSISTWSPTPIMFAANGGVEVGMSKSQNEQYVMYFGSNQGNTLGDAGASTAHVWDGFPKDSADNVWVIASSDAGTNWTGHSVGYDGDISAAPSYMQGRYGAYFENFGQVDGVITNSGEVHLVANGYGAVLNATLDTLIANAFPILYYNSKIGEWKSISDINIDTITNDIMADFRPGNGIGQSWPNIAANADGSVLFVTWTGPQITAGAVDVDVDNAKFWTDIYYSYSIDSGDTWTYGGVLAGAGAKDVSEEFAHPAQFLESLGGNKFRAHIVYLADLAPGSFISSQGASTDNPIMYHTFDIDAGPVGVNDNNIVNSFELKQNYPNPFNPNTSIKYSVAERSTVTLKVFDMLGREVSTLVNTVKEAGNYEVNFNAANLSSGLYIYTINAGNYSSTKKMMLLK